MRKLSSFVLVILVCAALDLLATASWAAKLGPEFPVNADTAGEQNNVRSAALSNGGFVVVWTSQASQGAPAHVYGRIFRADRSPVGRQFKVATADHAVESEPSVAGLRNGGFVVTWTSQGADRYEHIFAQRLTARGLKVGEEFQVDTIEGARQWHASVAGLAGGGFIVAWLSQTPHVSAVWIRAQRYTAGGGKVGSQFDVTPKSGDIFDPHVAALPSGGFLMVWSGPELVANDPYNQGVFGRLYDKQGKAVGKAFKVNTTKFDDQISPAIAVLSNGGFFVAWMSSDQDASYNIYGQKFASDGEKIGPEFRVNDRAKGGRYLVGVAIGKTDRVVVIWGANYNLPSLDGVLCQEYNVNGERRGPQFKVSNSSAGMSVTALAGGPFVVFYLRGSPGTYDVFGQAFN